MVVCCVENRPGEAVCRLESSVALPTTRAVFNLRFIRGGWYVSTLNIRDDMAMIMIECPNYVCVNYSKRSTPRCYPPQSRQLCHLVVHMPRLIRPEERLGEAFPTVCRLAER